VSDSVDAADVTLSRNTPARTVLRLGMAGRAKLDDVLAAEPSRAMVNLYRLQRFHD